CACDRAPHAGRNRLPGGNAGLGRQSVRWLPRNSRLAYYFKFTCSFDLAEGCAVRQALTAQPTSNSARTTHSTSCSCFVKRSTSGNIASAPRLNNDGFFRTNPAVGSVRTPFLRRGRNWFALPFN